MKLSQPGADVASEVINVVAVQSQALNWYNAAVFRLLCSELQVSHN